MYVNTYTLYIGQQECVHWLGKTMIETLSACNSKPGKMDGLNPKW
jgi:hypothetical protein